MIQVDFKFEIGDLVTMRTFSAIKVRDRFRPGRVGDVTPQAFQVIGRMMEECHGGCQQNTYACRAYIHHGEASISFGTELIKINEMELALYEPPQGDDEQD